MWRPASAGGWRGRWRAAGAGRPVPSPSTTTPPSPDCRHGLVTPQTSRVDIYHCDKLCCVGCPSVRGVRLGAAPRPPARLAGGLLLRAGARQGPGGEEYCTVTTANTNTSCVQVNGTYVYPDWSSCVAGTWRDHVLVQGRYCRVTTVVTSPLPCP